MHYPSRFLLVVVFFVGLSGASSRSFPWDKRARSSLEVPSTALPSVATSSKVNPLERSSFNDALADWEFDDSAAALRIKSFDAVSWPTIAASSAIRFVGIQCDSQCILK
jgi:hypothetical protein